MATDADEAGPHVFETADSGIVSSADESRGYHGHEEEEEDVLAKEDIIQLHLKAHEAGAKFKHAILDASDADYTNPLFRRGGRHRRGQRRVLANSGVLLPESLVQRSMVTSSGDTVSNETPVEKLRRLIYETSELESELVHLQQADVEEKAEDGMPPEKLLQHVSILQKQLSEMQTTADGVVDRVKKSASEFRDEESFQSVLSQIKTFQGATKSEKKTSAPETSTGAAGLTYELSLNAATGKAMSETRMADLDGRLSLLEQLAGNGTASNKIDAATDIWTAMDRLESQLSYISDVKQSDMLVKLCRMANAEFDVLINKQQQALPAAAAAADGMNEEIKHKVDALYDALKQAESWIGFLPTMVNRLTALQSLHVDAAMFAENLKVCTDEQQKVRETLQLALNSYTLLEEQMKKNEAVMMKNMASLTERMSLK